MPPHTTLTRRLYRTAGICALLALFLLPHACKQPVLFTVQDDVKLGQQLEAEIAANPQEYPILDQRYYPEAYDYLGKIVSRILNSGQVKYRNEFAWKFKIIRDDRVQNAFCAPGGYIYVYTGLIKTLDAEHELAGVLGHEIAHADLRHTSRKLERAYGLQVLADIVLGENQGALTNVLQGVLTLRFSRDFEREADDQSVVYLCPTSYQADGAAAFFEKILESGAQSPPVFLSTHPDPGQRVRDIRAKAQNLSCTGRENYDTAYQRFKNQLLP